MTRVEMEKSIVEDLLNDAIEYLEKEIAHILEDHGYSDAGKFLSDINLGNVKNGDVIGSRLKQFIDKVADYAKILDCIDEYVIHDDPLNSDIVVEEDDLLFDEDSIIVEEDDPDFFFEEDFDDDTTSYEEFDDEDD